MIERTKRTKRRHTIIETIEQERRVSEAVASWQDDEEAEDVPPTHGNAPRRVRLQSAYRFGMDFEPPDFLAEPFLRSGTLYGLTAATGTGKTGFLLTLCLAIASGRSDILGTPVKQGRVVFIAIENPAEARARLVVSAGHFSVLVGQLPDQFVVISERCTPEDLLHSLAPLGNAGYPIALIVIDSYSAMFDGVDMNSATEALEFLRRLRPATSLLGSPAVVIATHPGKNAGNDDLVPAGSGMLLNELDANLVLKKYPADGRVDLHWQGKVRGLDFAPVPFSFEMATHPFIVDSSERPMALPVMRPHVPSQPKPAALTDKRSAPPTALLEAMLADPHGTQRDWASVIGCSQAMIGKHLGRLAKRGLTNCERGRWQVTENGAAEASKS